MEIFVFLIVINVKYYFEKKNQEKDFLLFLMKRFTLEM